MNRLRDLRAAVLDHVLDAQTADRLLAGDVHPDDAPPGYGDAAGILRALIVPATDSELADEGVAVVEAIEIVNGRTAERRGRRTLRRAKLTSLIVLGSLVATGTAAATNVLPDPVQEAVADTLSRVGVDVPSPGDARPPATDPASETSVRPRSRDGASEIGDTSSAIAGGTARARKGARMSTAASRGRSRAGEHGIRPEREAVFGHGRSLHGRARPPGLEHRPAGPTASAVGRPPGQDGRADERVGRPHHR